VYHLVSLRFRRHGIVFGRNQFGARWVEVWRGGVLPEVIVHLRRPAQIAGVTIRINDNGELVWR
jgi:hypothetical protein